MARSLKPLAPKSKSVYGTLLARAYGVQYHGMKKNFGSVEAALSRIDLSYIPEEVRSWTVPMRTLFRAAYVRACRERGMDPGPVLRGLPEEHQITRQARLLSEQEATAFENAARELKPRWRGAVALLPLALGLRAQEVCDLTREDVERAVKGDSLTFVRKGGMEHTMPVRHARELFKIILKVPRAAGITLAEREGFEVTPRMWDTVGEILSTGDAHAQYRALHRLVQRTAGYAGIGKLSPHKLRHAFATRMNRDGAPIATIAAALNHKNINTTQLYVHPSAADIARHMRPF